MTIELLFQKYLCFLGTGQVWLGISNWNLEGISAAGTVWHFFKVGIFLSHKDFYNEQTKSNALYALRMKNTVTVWHFSKEFLCQTNIFLWNNQTPKFS